MILNLKKRNGKNDFNNILKKINDFPSPADWAINLKPNLESIYKKLHQHIEIITKNEQD